MRRKLAGHVSAKRSTIRLGLELLESRLSPAVITVTTTADDLTPNDGSVSLREAITAINAGNNLGDPDIIAQNPGTFGSNDTIHFNLPGTGPFQISVGSDSSASHIPLPALTRPVLIDGPAQSGQIPFLVVNGAEAGANANGFDLRADGITIQHLIINGFSGNGVLIEANDSSRGGDTLFNNWIGTNATGSAAVGNGRNGVFIDGNDSNNAGLAASNNLIHFNIISGNSGDGVLIQAHNGVASGNGLIGNSIGLNGEASFGGLARVIPNGGDGVTIDGASGNRIGGGTIVGNVHDGIHIKGTLAFPAAGNTVDDSIIGIAEVFSGTALLGNAAAGIEIEGGINNTIGACTIGDNLYGIELDNGAQNNVIQANGIGGVEENAGAPVLNIGNHSYGIVLHSDGNSIDHPGQVNEPGVRNNLIGGTGTGDGNVVAFNGQYGIVIYGNPVSLSGQANSGNTIEGNSIYQNGVPPINFFNPIGIELTNTSPFPGLGDGFTPNDSKGHGAANDPNNFQNFPVLTSASIVAGPSIHIRGSLTQSISPSTSFRVEFFGSDPPGLPLEPEGQYFLGFINVTTDGTGHASFDFNFPLPPALNALAGFKPLLAPGEWITATATDLLGNTSEFSEGLQLMGSSGQSDPANYVSPISLGGSTGIVSLTIINGTPFGAGTTLAVVNPFPGFTGEIHRAVGDLNGDGIPDVAYAPGAGMGPQIHVVNGKTQGTIVNFYAFDPRFMGGVFVAIGDVNGDGVQDIIAAVGGEGGPEVKVIDGKKLSQILPNTEVPASDLLADFYAYGPTFSGGLTLAAADINGDGHADIVTGAGSGGGPHVKVIDGTKLGDLQNNAEIADSALLAQFYAYSPLFPGGVFVATGDVNGDGVPDIVTGAGAGGSPHVKVIDGTKLDVLTGAEISDTALLGQFYAYDPHFNGGVRVDTVDANPFNGRPGGLADIVTGAGPGGGPEIKVIDAARLNVLIDGQPAGLLADFNLDLSAPFGLQPAVPLSSNIAIPSLRSPTFDPATNGLYGPTFNNTPFKGKDNITNLYIFRDPNDTAQTPNFGNTDIIATLCPFAGVLTPEGFDPNLTLDINVVNTQGHLTPDFTFRFTFGPPVPDAGTFDQVVTVKLIQGNTTTTIATYTYVGTQTIPPAAFPNNITFPGDAIATGKFIAGSFDDPSFIDASGLNQFLATGNDPAHPFPRPGPLDPNNPGVSEAKNYFHNANTLAVVLEVPTTKLTTANPPLLGIWAVSSVKGVQVQRLGRSLIDGILIPPVPRNDLSHGQRQTAFNLGSPSTDVANFRSNMIAVLTNPNFIYHRSATQAAALVDSVFGSTIVGANTGLLPDILTVDLSKIYTDPTNGFLNGRRLRDDVTDTMFQLLTGNPSFNENVGDDNGAIITDGLDGPITLFPYIGRPNVPPGGPSP
jgi:CSLREA domain-containing protein